MEGQILKKLFINLCCPFLFVNLFCFNCLLKAGKGGELTHDETMIISGALDLTEKVICGCKRRMVLHLKFVYCIFSITNFCFRSYMQIKLIDCPIWILQTAEEAMTPIESTFSLDVNSKLDWYIKLVMACDCADFNICLFLGQLDGSCKVKQINACLQEES